MSIIIPANSAAGGGDLVTNSVRFNGGSNDHLKRTLGTATNVKKFTMSWWFKGTGIATGCMFEAASGNVQNGAFVYLKLDDILIDSIVGNSETMKLIPTAHYQDYSAWYHFCLAVDVTLGTAADRNKLYINGERVTSFVTQTNAGQNAARMFNTAIEHLIGIDVYNSGGGLATPFNGYMSEFVFIDGLQEDPTSFGEFDEDSNIWKPIDVSGLTFGNNGFYLNFSNSGNLGEDFSGNDNDFTVVNLTANSQSTDTCTNNFATMNPNFAGDPSITYSEGNLAVLSTAAAQSNVVSSIAVSSGKWYCEMVSRVGTNYPGFGIMDSGSVLQTTVSYLGSSVDSYCMFQDGVYYTNGSTDSTGITWGVGVVMGIAIDLDSGTKTIKLYKAGSEQHSATIATPANAYYFATSMNTNNVDADINFGSPPYTESGGYSDANGYGNFHNAVPSGYLALCTKNLSEVNS